LFVAITAVAAATAAATATAVVATVQLRATRRDIQTTRQLQLTVQQVFGRGMASNVCKFCCIYECTCSGSVADVAATANNYSNIVAAAGCHC